MVALKAQCHCLICRQCAPAVLGHIPTHQPVPPCHEPRVALGLQAHWYPGVCLSTSHSRRLPATHVHRLHPDRPRGYWRSAATVRAGALAGDRFHMWPWHAPCCCKAISGECSTGSTQRSMCCWRNPGAGAAWRDSVRRARSRWRADMGFERNSLENVQGWAWHACTAVAPAPACWMSSSRRE